MFDASKRVKGMTTKRPRRASAGDFRWNRLPRFSLPKTVLLGVALSLALPQIVTRSGENGVAAAYASSQPMARFAPTPMAPAVQLFDVAQGRVVRSAPNSMAFRRLGESWIASIRSAWGGFRLDPESGYVLKIPFEPAVPVSNGWYRGEVRELYIMWDPAKPHDTRMMLLGRDGNPRVFYLKADAGAFVEKFKDGQRAISGN